MKVVILHGHIPPDAAADELDTLEEAAAVEAALRRLGHGTSRLEFTLDLRRTADALREKPPDVVFNLVESVEGSGRLAHLAPGLLEYLRVPFTGGSAESLLLTGDKVLAKRFMAAFGIPTPAWVTPRDPEGSWCYPPYIVKSVWEHASIGLGPDSILYEERDLEAFMTTGNDREAEWFAERYIEGREFNLSLIGNRGAPWVLPPAEMTFRDFPPGKPRIVDYAAKWDAGSFEYANTVRSFDFPPEDRGLLEKLEGIARRCWTVFGLAGYARVDFRVEAGERPWVLEVNVNPCISPDAGFAVAAARAGLGFDAVVERLVREALGSTSP